VVDINLLPLLLTFLLLAPWAQWTDDEHIMIAMPAGASATLAAGEQAIGSFNVPGTRYLRALHT
jgi:hypothetical protein